MKQSLPKCFSHVNYAEVTSLGGLADGSGVMVFGFSRYPVISDGTLRNLVVYGGAVRPNTLTITVMVDGVASGLTATLLTTDTLVVVPGPDVAVLAGQYVEYRVVGSALPAFGTQVAMCIEWEATEQHYGIAAVVGSTPFGSGKYGGGFGNGFWQDWPGIPARSTSHSIAAINGSITKLRLRRFNNSYVGGAWTGYIIKNEVIQDGSGGTVNTACVLADAATQADVTFAPVTIAPLDIVDVVILRSVTDATFALQQVGASINFIPTTPGEFMFCGGSNDAIPAVPTTWKWNRSEQGGATIGIHTAPAGVAGFRTTGLFIERNIASGAAATNVHTLLQNGVATGLVVSISGAFDLTGQVLGEVTYAPNDLVTIQIERVNGAQNSPMYWSVGATAEDEPPPPECPGDTGDPRGDGLPYTIPTYDVCAGSGATGSARTGT